MLGMLVALGFVSPPVHAAPHSQQHVVRVGIYENPPKLLLDSQARPGGIMGELLLGHANQVGANPWVFDDDAGRRCHLLAHRAPERVDDVLHEVGGV